MKENLWGMWWLGWGKCERVLLMDSLAISDSLITAFSPGQVFFVESVCDDPDVIAANILVGEPPAHTCLCLACVCGWGWVEGQLGNESERDMFSRTG